MIQSASYLVCFGKREREKQEKKVREKKSKKKRRERKKSVRKKEKKKQNSDLSRLNLVVEFSDWNLFCALFSKTGITSSNEVCFGSASTQMKASDEPHLNSCRS